MGGAHRIPWSAIERHAESFLFADPEELARILWAMDEVYLKHLDALAAKPAQENGPSHADQHHPQGHDPG